MTGKHPAAVELGRLGGSAKSEAKTAAARVNAKLGGWPKGRPRKPSQALDVLHAAVAAEATYRLALINSSRRDSVAVRQRWLDTGAIPY